jgi:hypothetical protein
MLDSPVNKLFLAQNSSFQRLACCTQGKIGPVKFRVHLVLSPIPGAEIVKVLESLSDRKFVISCVVFVIS